MAIYDLGPAPVARVSKRLTPVALEVRAPLWFDTMGIDYRLLYIDGAQLREYARARWVGPPAQLLQQRLGQQLAYATAGQSQSRCLIRLEITEFGQHFVRTDLSYGIVQGRAILLDRARRPLAELPIDLKELAPSPDARGGVAALTTATNRLVDELSSWEGRMSAAGVTGACS